jgi:hypothetical protein
MPSETNDGKVQNLEILSTTLIFKGALKGQAPPMKREQNLCDH